MSDAVEQLTLFDLDICAGRMYPEPSPAEPQKARTSVLSWRKLLELKTVPVQCLDLTPGHGNLLGQSFWEINSAWLGVSWTLSTGVSPSVAKESSLSQILQDDPPHKYYLSRTACLGILRRADARGKELPFQLKQALQVQAGVMAVSQEVSDLKAYHINQRDEGIDLHGVSGALMATTNMQMQTFVTGGPVVAFAANQRDEVRDLHDVAAALGAQPGMKQQTFVAGITAKGNGDCFLSPERHTSLSGGGGQAGQGYPCILTAGFSAGAGSSAGSIGYGEEVAPTLKGTASGNCMPSILCLNDQGGSAMACSEDVTGTLRAQEHGHQPLVFDNHGQDTRFLGPVNAAQTVSATFGMGGNNQPLVVAEREAETPILFENHGIDARYTGPHKVAPTMSARYGTGGNNVPLVAQRDDTFCITGNAIDRQPMNGGNGIGYQQGIAYTLTATDHLSGYPDK